MAIPHLEAHVPVTRWKILNMIGSLIGFKQPKGQVDARMFEVQFCGDSVVLSRSLSSYHPMQLIF
jgi:hypothetical protein